MPTPAQTKTLAWRTKDCRRTTCKQPAGRRCIDAKGNRVPPHLERLADLALDLGVQVDELQRAIDQRDTLNSEVQVALKAATDAQATLEAKNTDLSRRVSEAADDLAGVRQQLTSVSGELDDTRKQLKDALARIDELEQPQTPTFTLGMAYESNTDPTPVEKRLGFVLDSRRTYHGTAASAVAVVKANIAAGRRVSSLSFKAPFPWLDMSTGKGDSWATNIRDKLAAVIAGTGHIVKIAINHEPENDGGQDAGNTAAGRDRWRAMQLRLAPIFDRPGFQFIVILMGMHSTRASDPLYKIWRLDLVIPDHPAIKGVGYDLYQFRGRVQKGKTTPDGWSPQEADYKAIQAFHATRPGLAWGLSETAHTEVAESEKPGLVATTVGLVVKYGGSWLEWFNSNLNSTAKWEMDPGSGRERSFAGLR